MIKRNTVWLLVGALLFSNFPFYNPVSAASPEDKCFAHLTNAAKSNPAFKDLDLSRVRKISGKNRQLKSEPFSVETYSDFTNTFNREVPYFQSDLEYYPNDMNQVGSDHKYKPKVHKSNRNNTASIIYNNGSKSSINHWMPKGGSSAAADIKKFFAGKRSASLLDNKYHRQKIDGWYLNSKYVTFGRESDLDFAFPARAANPANDAYYPTGRPVMDMREYQIFTHHLKPSRGGDLLSCQLVKVVPQSPFKLKDYNYSGKSVAWENYGGTQMSASNVKTTRINNQFRKAEIEYTINTRQNPNDKLLRFYALSVNYNNNNGFLNTYRTVEMFNEAMRDAKNANQTFLEMRRAFYNKVIGSDLTIGAGATTDDIEGLTSVNPAPSANWTRCAEEDQTCSFSGTSDIRYGLNGSFYYKKATDSIECSNDEFGDPLVGTTKRCWYDSNQASAAPSPSPFLGGKGSGGGGGGGGTVICTHYNQKGLLSDALYEAEKEYGENADPRLYAGYLLWAKPFVAWLEKNEWADFVVAPLVNAWAEQVAYTQGRLDHGNWLGKQMMRYGEPITLALGSTTLVQNSIMSSEITTNGDF